MPAPRPISPGGGRIFLRRRAALPLALALAGLATGTLAGCGKTPPAPRQTVAAATAQKSASCRDCHREVFAAWENTDHALANRPVARDADAAALAALPPSAAAGPAAAPEFVLGHRPLWQPLLPAPGGRWQAHDLAYDPARMEWFNVLGAETRQPGEWGHWTGRGMNWNSMCAQCHMTGYQKNYEAAADTYRSTWVEHGVGCIQCHGPTAPGHGAQSQAAPAAAKGSPPFFGDRARMAQTCAPCHARGEALTADFQPGDLYADHHRLALPSEPGAFHPDGQQREEVFNWASVQLSRMGHAGVTCLDCHDPHTTKTILPAANNQLCQQCHAPPGRVLAGGIRAVPIDPPAHSHHAEGGAGNSCVACHMPTTTHMQRAPRHDHGWPKPDPLLTKELGIPNACATCHREKSTDALIAQADTWFGPKLDSRQRARARAVAAAQGPRPDTAAPALLALLAADDIPAWRATYLSLLSAARPAPEIIAAGRRALTAADPLERAAGVRLLTPHEPAKEWVRPLLQDPVRLVRLDAAWALSPELAAGAPERRELDAHLALALDQPAGRLRLGQDLANRGRLPEAEKEMALAIQWDQSAPAMRDAHGLVLAALGRPADAAAEFRQAAELLPADATVPLRAALAFAQAGRPAEAEAALRTAVARDANLDRAWYNLGLLLAQKSQWPEATAALNRAAALAPAVADYSYALATVLLRAGDRAGARAAAQRALFLDPAHEGARQILRLPP